MANSLGSISSCTIRNGPVSGTALNLPAGTITVTGNNFYSDIGTAASAAAQNKYFYNNFINSGSAFAIGVPERACARSKLPFWISF